MDIPTYLSSTPIPFWQFVGECGLDKKGGYLTTSQEEYVFWLRLGIVFLRHTHGEPPSNWTLDVLWANAPHGEGLFPIIAIGFHDGEESEAAMAYAKELEKDLRIFDRAVDWKEIASHPLRSY